MLHDTQIRDSHAQPDGSDPIVRSKLHKGICAENVKDSG